MDPSRADPREAGDTAAQLRRLASEGQPVLLLGPDGAAAEALARRIHELSGRTGPFVRYLCRPMTLDEARVRSLSCRCAGLFERASGGTLYFHQVHRLSAQEQRQLYSVLERGRYWLPGTNSMRPVDFRLVASGPPDILQRGLAPDLLYRLGVRILAVKSRAT